MRRLRRASLVATVVSGVAMAGVGVPADAKGQAPADADSLEAWVFLDRGDEPVVWWGEEIRVYYRVSADAFVAVFRMNTDGAVELLFPSHALEDTEALGGRDYRLLFPERRTWRVEDAPGVGYFFVVAAPEPLDFSSFEGSGEGWDPGGTGGAVYEDPYLAIDDYVAAVLPAWQTTPYAVGLTEYRVDDGTGAVSSGAQPPVRFRVMGPRPSVVVRFRTPPPYWAPRPVPWGPRRIVRYPPRPSPRYFRGARPGRPPGYRPGRRPGYAPGRGPGFEPGRPPGYRPNRGPPGRSRPSLRRRPRGGGRPLAPEVGVRRRGPDRTGPPRTPAGRGPAPGRRGVRGGGGAG